MAWTSPKTYTAAVLTAAELNTYQRDNMLMTAPGIATATGKLIVTSGANTIVERTPTATYIATSETTASASFADLTTVGPAVTVTTGSEAIVVVTCQLSNDSAGARALMGYAISGATTLAAAAARSLTYESGNAGDFLLASYMGLVAGLTPGSNVFTAKYLATTGNATFVYRALTVIPL